MEIKNQTRTMRKILETGMQDVVDNNGVLMEDVPIQPIMVRSQSDLANLPDKYFPGAVAYTAGFGSMWQLAADGDWEAITSGGGAA